MTLFNDEAQVSPDEIFAQADELRNDGSQPSQQPSEEEQRVPYERFKEVNDERKKLQEQLDAFIKMQAQAAQQSQQAAQQPQQQFPAQQTQPVQQPAQPQQLFTDEELEAFETDIVVNPKETLKRFGDAIMQRGVNARTQQLEQTFEQRFAQLQAQLVSQTLPTVIDNYKRSRFDASMAEEAAVFDQFLQNVPPTALQDQAALENIRLAAIGFVADKRRQQGTQNRQGNVPFTEQPGSGLPAFFGGQPAQAQPQVPREVIEAGRRMGLDPKDVISMYTAMNNNGVFR